MEPPPTPTTADQRMLAGAAGFEPANAGTKNRCLTTWRRPSRRPPKPWRRRGSGAYSQQRPSWKAQNASYIVAMTEPAIRDFHAHIYYDPEQVEQAKAV